MSALLLATARDQVADFAASLLGVYTLLILAYILTQLYFSFGGRVPYARWSSAVLGFLRDVVEPFLALFRRFIPPLGPIDISPLVALIVLRIVGGLIVAAIRG